MATEIALIATTADARRAAHAATIQQLQTTLADLQYQYADSTLAFVALHTAWQAARVAWYAVRYEELQHLTELLEAVGWLTADTGDAE